MTSTVRAWVLVYMLLMAGVAAVGLLIGGSPLGIDHSVMMAISHTRTNGQTTVWEALTTVFSPTLVPIWAVLGAAVLALHDRRIHRLCALLGSVAMAAVIAEAIKLMVARPRPPAGDQVHCYEATLSYPSGHVTGTAALLLAVALLVTAGLRTGLRVVAVTLALAVTVVIAWTRLYLGVHWLTDVAAGLAVGAATAVVAVAVIPAVITVASPRIRPRLSRRAGQWLAPPPDREQFLGATQ